MSAHLEQSAGSTDIETFDHRSLGQICVRQQNATIAGVPGGNRHGQRTPDRPQVSLEADLAQDGVISQWLLRDLPAGYQNAKRDGQVERRALFSDVGWGKVDGDPSQRK
jgi:hypothetical protein